jgi:threonine/homoserine/homoserine lactone efflux protein
VLDAHQTLSAYAAFALTAAVLVVTPGSDTVLVMRTAAVTSRSTALRVAAGCCIGVLGWAFVASHAGTLLAADRGSLTMVRLLGAFYLIWLSVSLYISPAQRPIGVTREPQRDVGARTGLLCNLSNPKIGLFYLIVVPRFVPIGAQARPFLMRLACVQAVEAMSWFALLLWGLEPLRVHLEGPRAQRVLNIAAATVLLGCAIGVLTDIPTGLLLEWLHLGARVTR